MRYLIMSDERNFDFIPDKKLISESKPDYYIDDFRDIIKLI